MAEAPVLRALVFIGAERCEDLNARNNLLMDGFRKCLYVLKDAVDAEPNPEPFMSRVDMDVRSIQFLSPLNQGLHDLYDGNIGSTGQFGLKRGFGMRN